MVKLLETIMPATYEKKMRFLADGAIRKSFRGQFRIIDKAFKPEAECKKPPVFLSL